MKKAFTVGLAALALVGSTAVAAPASAAPWPYYGYHHYGWGPGAVVAGGLLGLALGAAIASHPAPPPYYGPAYYGPPPGYRMCTARRTVWDPYARAYVVQPYSYAC
jgi:hypothetical protein